MAEVLTKDRIKKIRESLNAAMRAVSEEHGLKLEIGTIRFGETTFTARIDASLTSAEPPEVTAFKLRAASLGIDPGALGQSYVERGRTYRITGLAPRGSRVYLERDDGKGFVGPSSSIALRFPVGGRQSAPSSAAPSIASCGADALGQYLDDSNHLAAIFGRKPASRPTCLDECWPVFAELAGLLEPENLTADGERPRREVERLRSLYTRAWADLEKIAGRKVTEEEVFAQAFG